MASVQSFVDVSRSFFFDSLTQFDQRIQSTISNNRIVIFSKSWCPHCDAAKELFKSNYKDEEPFVVE